MPESEQNQQLTQSGFQETTQIVTENQPQDVKRTPLWRKILCGIFCLSSIASIVLLIYDFVNGNTWWYDTYDYLALSLEIILSLGLIPIGILLNTEYKPSRLIKGFGGLFGLGGIIILIGLSLDFYKYGFNNDIGEYLSILLSLGLILIGILINYTQEIEAYYHPSWLTRILSGGIRFIGISLILCGLYNFLLIGSEEAPFLTILLVGGALILCGICFIILGLLLYHAKKMIKLSATFVFSIVIGICFGWILENLGREIFGHDDSEIKQSILGICLYFYLITIIWGIRCSILKKWGKSNGKMLNPDTSSKKIGYITTGILFLILIANIIYGKIQWSKIPEIDESIFDRDYHQTKLPEEEDALIQLRAYNSGDIAYVLQPLDSYHLYLNGNSYTAENNKEISWKWHPEECIVINTGGNEYCGTWAWNKDTLDRSLNNYYYLGDNSYTEDYVDDEGYLSIDGKKVTIFEYIQENEPEIRKAFQELDRIVSLDYYLPNDEILDLVPSYLQGHARASMVALQYYIYQEDWDMVMFIIKLNYKIIDIFNTTGSVVYQLISIVLQGIIDSSVNSYMQLLPEGFRNELSERYSTQVNNKSEIIDKMMKGEYVMWNRAKAGNILGEVGYGAPSLSQFLFHFPFFSSKEINNFMNYSYYTYWNSINGLGIDVDVGMDTDDLISTHSIYNRYGKYPYSALMPRVFSVKERIDRSIYHKESLIKNLKSGKYDVRYGELDWESDSYNYKDYRILTNKELIEDLLERYSDIVNQCIGKDKLNSDYDFGFGYTCLQTLSDIKKQKIDNFGLREVLIKINQLRIDYSDNWEEKTKTCQKEGNDCGKIFEEGEKIMKEIDKSYIELIKILENIKNEAPDIDIDEYFYIPEMIYDIRDELINTENDNTELNNTETNNTDLNNSELSGDVNNIFKNYSDITNPCFGEDIIDPHPSIGRYHNEFEEACLNTLKELKGQEDDEFGLKEILIELTKSLINHSKFEPKVDACWLEDGILPKACDEIFDKEDELINKIKENYNKLSEILKNIEDENQGLISMDDYFYIPYNKVNDKSNGLIVSFIIDQEKAEQILEDLKSQEDN